MRAPLSTAAVLLALLPAALAAQDRNPAGILVPDRPGLGDGMWVVAPGVVQAEAGATLESAGGDRSGVGSALVRLGFAPLELRVQLPSLLLSTGPDDVEVGDLGLGVKVPLSWGGSWRWSVVGGATFATGTNGGTAGGTTGFGTLVGETSLTELLGFALNVGYTAPFDEGGDGTASLIATPLFPLSGRLAGYLGYAGFFELGPASDGHFVEWGVTGTVGADTQWDLNAAREIDGDRWFFGVGLSRRRR